MKAALALAVLTLAASAHAGNCFGTGSFRTCTDDSGNTYNIQQYGNSTHVQGSNAGTGSLWSQDSYRYGNTTQTTGRAANGSSWNETTTTSPGMVQQYGTDSRGRSFQRTCTAFGCY